MKCPGQDSRYWGAEAAFEVPCPACGNQVEFFKDESRTRCPACGFRFRNPKMDLGCAEWCPNASACLGTLDRTGGSDEGSLVDELLAFLHSRSDLARDDRDLALAALVQAQSLLLEVSAAPRLTMLGALLAALPEPSHWLEPLAERGPSLLELSTAASIAEGTATSAHATETQVVRDALALARFDLALRDAAGQPPGQALALPDNLHSKTAQKLAREIARRRGHASLIPQTSSSA